MILVSWVSRTPVFKAIPVRYTTTTSTLTSLNRGRVSSQSIKDFFDHASKRIKSKLCIKLGLKIFRTVGDVLNDVISDVFFRGWHESQECAIFKLRS